MTTTWTELNKRQQVYLQSVFEVDQEKETARKRGGMRSWDNTPASIWRWMPYNASGASLLTKI